jgi:hypothetical protein
MDFCGVLERQPPVVKSMATDLLNRLRNGEKTRAVFKPLENSLDDKFRSVALGESHSMIVSEDLSSGVCICLMIDGNEAALGWAANKICRINEVTGDVQVSEISRPLEAGDQDLPPIFFMVDDDQLVSLGVDKDLVPYVRSLRRPEDFYNFKGSLPVLVADALEFLAEGIPVPEVFELFKPAAPEGGHSMDLKEALRTDGSRAAFVVIEGEEELRSLMSEPLEKWRLFLHPRQRALVERDYSGPTRVLGGAGTGKTVVAMHRAKFLAGRLGKGERLLFTTFTRTLADDIRDNLKKICSPEEFRRIDVANLDALVAGYLKEHGYKYDIVFDNSKLGGLWRDAVINSDVGLDFPDSFYQDEWSTVAASQEAFTREDYLVASRLGRGVKLDRKKRLQVWSVFEAYQSLMRERRKKDVDSAMYECRLILEKKHRIPLYRSVVVDETQDFNTNALKLIRAMAGEEKENDLFLVGDSHQRIYKRKAVLSQCGINIRGRGSILRMNYRTTEETRKFAYAMLLGGSYDDLDGGAAGDDTCFSLTKGAPPVVRHFTQQGPELEFVAGEVKKLVDAGGRLKDVCLVARISKHLAPYKEALRKVGLSVYALESKKSDDRNKDGVRLATMHRVKGLEFAHVFVVSANNKLLPLQMVLPSEEDKVGYAEALTSEKCLLYVALTRAQKSAYVTSFGAQSAFLSGAAAEVEGEGGES